VWAYACIRKYQTEYPSYISSHVIIIIFFFMKGPGRLASSSSQIKDCEFDNQNVAPIVGFLLTGNVIPECIQYISYFSFEENKFTYTKV